MSSHSVAGKQECELCGGPCREPFKPPPVNDNYPFLTQEQIVATQRLAEADDPQTDAEPPKRAGKRARRPLEDRAHRPAEDRS